MTISRYTFAKKDDTCPQQVIRRTQAGGQIALVQVREGAETRQYPVFIVATHDNAEAIDLMDLGGWVVDGNGDIRPPDGAAQEEEYQGDMLEFLTYEEWRNLMLEYGGGVYVGQLGRAYFEKVVSVQEPTPDELEVESWKGALYLPSPPDSKSRCVAELRPLGSTIAEV